METFTDPWRPRDETWLARPPSPFAGRPGRPLFVMGCPRSGTTLLRAILDNHPELAMPVETDFVLPLWHDRPRFGDLRREENRRAVGDFVFATKGRGGRRIRGEVGRDEAVARVVSAEPTLGALIAACFSLYAERTGKPRWGDKRPRYAMHPDVLLALFPDAQFVNVVRDPRGAVASQIPMGWVAPEIALEASTVNWLASVERVDLVAAGLRPDQLLDVRYEDLVRDPVGELERLCAFAGLRGGDAVRAMLDAPRHGKRNEDLHRFVGAISPAPITGWQTRLAAEDAALVERAASSYLERFGYVATTGSSPTPAALRELERQRRDRRHRFRRLGLRELVRVATYRRPVAAPLESGAARYVATGKPL